MSSLSQSLSQALIAFTIEFDNEFESRLPHTTARGPAARSGRGPWLVSMAMWGNFMRFIDPDGVRLADLADQVRATNLAGLQRWGYVTVADAIVRPTAAGLRAQGLWRPLGAEIEDRWRARGVEVARIKKSLRAMAEPTLPHCLPVAGTAKLAVIPWSRPEPATDLAGLLSQALLAYTMEVDRESPLSLPLTANVMRVLGRDGVPARDLPRLSGVSKEAARASVNFLVRLDLATSEARLVRLTQTGEMARDRAHRLDAAVERGWHKRFGTAVETSLTALIPDLVPALTPPATGWRAHPPYLAQTKRTLADPAAALPHYPMVSHRGGFPDGS